MCSRKPCHTSHIAYPTRDCDPQAGANPTPKLSTVLPDKLLAAYPQHSRRRTMQAGWWDILHVWRMHDQMSAAFNPTDNYWSWRVLRTGPFRGRSQWLAEWSHAWSDYGAGKGRWGVCHGACSEWRTMQHRVCRGVQVRPGVTLERKLYHRSSRASKKKQQLSSRLWAIVEAQAGKGV